MKTMIIKISQSHSSISTSLSMSFISTSVPSTPSLTRQRPHHFDIQFHQNVDAHTIQPEALLLDNEYPWNTYQTDL